MPRRNSSRYLSTFLLREVLAKQYGLSVEGWRSGARVLPEGDETHAFCTPPKSDGRTQTQPTGPVQEPRATTSPCTQTKLDRCRRTTDGKTRPSQRQNPTAQRRTLDHTLSSEGVRRRVVGTWIETCPESSGIVAGEINAPRGEVSTMQPDEKRTLDYGGLLTLGERRVRQPSAKHPHGPVPWQRRRRDIYVAANVTSMPHGGEKAVRGIIEDGHRCLLNMQVTDARRPLMSRSHL